jgi:uncharacterized membrane-anchored protein
VASDPRRPPESWLTVSTFLEARKLQRQELSAIVGRPQRTDTTWGLLMTTNHASALRLAALAALFGLISIARAQDAQQPEDPGAAVWQAASEAMIHGPQTIELRDQAEIALPEGYGFVPAQEGAAVMNVLGNQTGENFIGLIFPHSEAAWFVTMDFEPAGYIKDDDAKEWDADELLESLKEGTKAANEHRKEIGVTPIEVTRWVEKPVYDVTAHRLVWSAEAKEMGVADQDPTINYNTYVLGRQGYISLNLITSASTIEAEKAVAHQLLSAVSFNGGKRYEDFDASTDKVAAYGLAALVGGVAAKKLGLLAMIGVFLAKFGKLLVVGGIALGAGAMKLLKRNKGDESAA